MKGDFSAFRKLDSIAEQVADNLFYLKSATPFPKCYLHKEKWTFDS